MRLQGLDIARFMAFCGMVLVNFRIAALVTPGTDLTSQITDALEGRAAALFVVLAGIGLSLANAPVPLILKRAAFLFVIGMMNMTIFDADILHFYALYFVVGAAFLSSSNRTLWFGIIGLVVTGVLSLLFLNYDTGWNWQDYTYSDFWTIEGFVRHSLFNGWHPVVPWAAFLLLGMRIGRLDLANNKTQFKLMIWGGIAAILALIPGYLALDPELQELMGTEAIPPGPFYILAGSGTASLAIGLILWLTPALEKTGLAVWLARPGRQSLTLYVAHILIGMGVLEEAGLLDGSLSPESIFGISLFFCVACAIYAWIWSFWFKRGPLEASMRWITERKA